MRSVPLALVLLLLGTTAACSAALAEAVNPGSPLAPSAPTFNLGFKALADQIPDVVGEPLEMSIGRPTAIPFSRLPQG